MADTQQTVKEILEALGRQRDSLAIEPITIAPSEEYREAFDALDLLIDAHNLRLSTELPAAPDDSGEVSDSGLVDDSDIDEQAANVVERRLRDYSPPDSEPVMLDSGESVSYGKPTAEFTTGATITLDPCNVHGTDNGLANETVYVQADKTSYSTTNSTTIPTTQIVPFILGDDGNCYMLGTPVEFVTDWDVDTVNDKVRKKTRNVWVLTPGTESAWVDVHTGDSC